MEELVAGIALLGVLTALALLWGIFRVRSQLRAQEERLAGLTRRVYELESGGRPAEAQPEPSAAPPPLPVWNESSPESPDRPAPVTAPVEAARTTATTTNDDWEAIIGGNWLNRVGALVLVIGIALFLGYSLTQLGPAGKVVIGFAVGVSMLAAGIALRASERYGNFSLSLVAGGWAAIYFTAYAAHALEPARVIDNPLWAALLLFAVSVGMILHALSYASEHGTALAFLFSFISLNVSPLTTFSLYAAVVLAMSMLALAYLRQWFRLAVAAILLTYATFILRRDAAEPLAQWALWIQWIAFEAFDILDLKRRGFASGFTPGVERSVFLVNAAGFLGASLLYQWNHLGWFLVMSALAYLLSTVVRARLVPADANLAQRVIGGGYEGALAASAALMAGACIERFNGTNMTLALLVEGEMIYLAGHALGNPVIRVVGAAVLSLAFFRSAAIDPGDSVDKRVWTPTASIVAAVLAVNRVRGGWAFAAGAGILAAMVIVAEVSRECVPSALAIAGTAALALAVSRGYADIRLQHIAWAIGTFFAGWIALDYGPAATLSVVFTIASFYVCQFLVRKDRYAPTLYSILGTVLLTLLLFEEVQGRLLTVALGIQGSLLLVAGMMVAERVLRISGLVLFLGCIAKAFIYDLRQLDTFGRILSFIVLGLLLLGASWVYTRFRERIRRLL